MPATFASSRTTNVVEAPGARLTERKVVVTVKPGGMAIGPVSVRLAVPTFLTVKVLLIGVPWGVLPKATLAPLAIAVVPESTCIFGAVVTVPVIVKLNALAVLSLSPNDTLPLKVPPAVALSVMTKVVEVFGANVVVPNDDDECETARNGDGGRQCQVSGPRVLNRKGLDDRST